MSGIDQDDIPTIEGHFSVGAPRPTSVKVICGDRVESFRLPEHGGLLIGRGSRANITIDDPSVSREHARLRVGATLSIEDLGSSNGVRLGGRALSANLPAEVHADDIIEIGSALLVLQGHRHFDGTVAPSKDRKPAEREQVDDVIVRDPATERIHRLVERVAAAPISVLLLGETGVGKEVIANLLHQRSPRAKKPFLPINCAAIPENILESELFGHEAGAFTGAAKRKLGLLESADGGTVFFDEIGEMPASLQAKLLRVLETREVMRVGATTSVRIDVRIVSATHRDLESEIQTGGFREDLFYRLNGIDIVIPPLRERRGEIIPLAESFIRQICTRSGRAPLGLSPEAGSALRRRTWLGNVRELRNVIERAVVLAEGNEITAADVAADVAADEGSDDRAAAPTAERPGKTRRPRLKSEITDLERQRIVAALKACEGNQSAAARKLGISRSTLLRRLKLYGL